LHAYCAFRVHGFIFLLCWKCWVLLLGKGYSFKQRIDVLGIYTSLCGVCLGNAYFARGEGEGSIPAASTP
jgi:hypothetical protein